VNGKSDNSAAKAEKPQPMKVEKNSMSATVKTERNSTSATVKTEKNSTSASVKTEKNSMLASVKIEKKDVSVKVEKTASNDSKVQHVKVEKDTKKPFSVPNGPPKLTSLVRCNDAARDKYRELLVDAFVKVSKETSDDDREEVRDLLDQVNACDPYRVAVTVESALFERIGRSTGTHKVKYRSILFNLKADNNPDFRRRVLLGEVRPVAWWTCPLTRWPATRGS